MVLTDYEVLTFDCYGTLIDWETGIYDALQSLLCKGGVKLTQDAVLTAFAEHEAALESEAPRMVYSDILAEVHRRLARQWGITVHRDYHEAFGRSVLDWPAFPDSPAALEYLKRHYKLVILSNIDHAGFAGSNRRLGVSFDAVYTAEDIGSYKPDVRNFEYMISELAKLGISKKRILHTAQSLFHDHVPANAAGLSSAWIDRRNGREGSGATKQPAQTPRYDFRFVSLMELAQAHQNCKSDTVLLEGEKASAV